MPRVFALSFVWLKSGQVTSLNLDHIQFMESDHDLICLFEQSLLGKSVPTFPDHALVFYPVGISRNASGLFFVRTSALARQLCDPSRFAKKAALRPPSFDMFGVIEPAVIFARTARPSCRRTARPGRHRRDNAGRLRRRSGADGMQIHRPNRWKRRGSIRFPPAAP
jgi:hypothetical protein